MPIQGEELNRGKPNGKIEKIYVWNTGTSIQVKRRYFRYRISDQYHCPVLTFRNQYTFLDVRLVRNRNNRVILNELQHLMSNITAK